MAVTGDDEPRVACPILQPWRQTLSGKVTTGGKPIEVRVRQAVRAVGGEQAQQRTHGSDLTYGSMGGITDVEHGVFDDGQLNGGLTFEMLVERGSPDAQFIGESAHGDSARSFVFQHLASRSDGLSHALRAFGPMIGSPHLTGEQILVGRQLMFESSRIRGHLVCSPFTPPVPSSRLCLHDRSRRALPAATTPKMVERMIGPVEATTMAAAVMIDSPRPRAAGSVRCHLAFGADRSDHMMIAISGAAMANDARAAAGPPVEAPQ